MGNQSNLLGENLKYLRDKKSQTVFANRLGVSRTSLSHWEIGRVIPRYKVIEMLASKLGYSVEDLMYTSLSTGVKMPIVATEKAKVLLNVTMLLELVVQKQVEIAELELGIVDTQQRIMTLIESL